MDSKKVECGCGRTYWQEHNMSCSAPDLAAKAREIAVRIINDIDNYRWVRGKPIHYDFCAETIAAALEAEWKAGFQEGIETIVDRENDQKEFNEGYRRGLQEAAETAMEWADSKSCDRHDSNPCCHVRTGEGIADRIRQLGKRE